MSLPGWLRRRVWVLASLGVCVGPMAAAHASVHRCMPPLAGAGALARSAHKVFAHYFSPFPLSLDDADPTDDAYARAMTPGGDSGRFRDVGGYLRERPLPRPSRRSADWAAQDVAQEVRHAAAIGLDGFAFDLLHTSGPNAERLRELLDAIPRVAPQFKILLMPDMNAEFHDHPERLVPSVAALAAEPALARDDRGRLVLAPFNAAARDATWWQAQVEALAARGVDVMFLPVFLDWKRSAPAYLGISAGLSWWGPRTPDRARHLDDDAREARRDDKLWMAPVSPQDFRPKSAFFLEAGGSELFRLSWEGAIRGGADWVHVITWNDYSEGTEIAPSTGIGYAFYDLSAYYLTWFKTGTAPSVPYDILYYFHRTQPAVPIRPGTRQTKVIAPKGEEPPRDEIEMLALLTAPGELEIAVGARTWRRQAEAGMTSFRVPLAPGRPRFALRRDGRAVLSTESDWTISADYPYQDLLYRAGCADDRDGAPR